MVRVILVHSGPVILPELEESLGVYAQKILAGRKVEIRLKTKIESFSGGAVRLSDGTMIPTNTLVWTAGTSPNPLLETIPCAKEGGRLLVTEFLELQGWPGVWALGDCSAIPNRLTGKFHPPTAQHALRQGKVAAHGELACRVKNACALTLVLVVQIELTCGQVKGLTLAARKRLPKGFAGEEVAEVGLPRGRVLPTYRWHTVANNKTQASPPQPPWNRQPD